jgi:hypothetical protein
MAKWLALHYFHQNWGTNVICCVYGIGNEDSFCMSPTHNLTPNYEEKLAKTMVGLSLVRSFGGHYTAARMASNAGIIVAGYAIGGTNGLLVAAGAELVNQTLRSTYARGATLASYTRVLHRPTLEHALKASSRTMGCGTLARSKGA